MNPSIDVAGLQHALASATPPLLFDVRRAAAFAQSDAMLAGAVWRDPAEAANWGQALSPEQEVVVYCVHGHEVSQGCAALLGARGIHARFLEGGFEAWRAAGGALSAR